MELVLKYLTNDNTAYGLSVSLQNQNKMSILKGFESKEEATEEVLRMPCFK